MRKLNEKIVYLMDERYEIYTMKGKICCTTDEAVKIVKKEIENYGKEYLMDMIKRHRCEIGIEKNKKWMIEQRDVNNILDDDMGRAEKEIMPLIKECEKDLDELIKKYDC